MQLFDHIVPRVERNNRPGRSMGDHKRDLKHSCQLIERKGDVNSKSDLSKILRELLFIFLHSIEDTYGTGINELFDYTYDFGNTHTFRFHIHEGSYWTDKTE